MTTSIASGSTSLSGMYYNQHFPLALVNLLQDLISNQQASPNTPSLTQLPFVREWFSQPRISTDPTGEVLTVNFKLPLSVGEFSIEILRVAATFEVWYQDRNNNWIAMPDENYQPMKVALSTSQTVDWYKYHAYTYPIVAKAVQFRITRKQDPTLGNSPYPIGLRNGLIRRNVYNRSSGTQAMEDEQDSLGNIITKYIDDWDATGAIDDDPNTFWRSEPLPSADAVANLYLKYVQPDGTGQLIAGLAIDPVYVNQNLNIYYSNDDTVGTRKLSPVGLAPDVDENTQWAAGTGLMDVSDVGGVSAYQFPLGIGPLINQDAWVGVEWKPDFSPTASNAVQFVSLSGAGLGGAFLLSLDGTHSTTPIDWNATAAAMQSALQALLGSNNVTVAGTPGAWSVTFQGDLAGEDITALSYDTTGLTGSSISMVVHTITVGGVGGGPPENPILFQVSPGADTVQVISIDGTPTGGAMQLSLDGEQYTSDLTDAAVGADVQAALESLSAIGTGNVLVVGDAGGPWSATFQGDLAQQLVPTLKAVSSFTGVPEPVVQVRTTSAGYTPPNPGGAQYWPSLFYDVGAQAITLELTNGVDAQTYTAPLTADFVQGAPLRIVAGWVYPDQITSPSAIPLPATLGQITSRGATDNAGVGTYTGAGLTDDAAVTDLGALFPTVFLSVATANGTQLGTLTANPVDLPTQMTLDGEVGYADFRGTMTALVVKLENFANGQAAFQANPATYVNPNPVQPDPNTGLVPSTTLDNAVYAVDWTLQNMGCGGGHASEYESKMWTPIFANYVTQKGKLFFPQPISLKYLKLEFSNLTEESYPVYDSGISVMYNVFPISVTQQVTTAKNVTPLSVVTSLLSSGGLPTSAGNASVNWLNPSTITAATSSVFGRTTQPITVQTGPGTITTSLPNTTGSDAGSSTTEVGTPYVYRRSLTNTQVLASQQLKALTNTAKGIVSNINNQFTPIISFSPSSASLPMQGADWWIVPGQTMVLAANVMQGLTQGTSVSLNRKPSTEYRLRFNATSVHQYQVKTAVRDAAIAYYAGVREISAFVLSYIANQDPAQFIFSPYDPNAWVYNNIVQLPSGPLSTGGITYQVQNPLFDTTLDNWTAAQGDWSIDPGMGKWQYGAATVVADGTEKELLSADITAWPQVTPGANFQVTVECQWSGVTSTGQPAVLAANYYDGDTYLSQQTASIAASGTSLWAAAGGQQIVGNFTVPANATRIVLGLVVTPAATAGPFWFDTVLIGSTDPVEGTTFIDIITQSTFVKVNCAFSDSGLVRSDDMWASEDLSNTNISATQLAWYTTTIPSVIPSGTWGDTMAKWGDTTITWGEPFSAVSINIDPNMTYNGKRVLHFTRAAGAEQAGIAVRQVTNFVANGMFRLGIIYFKPTASTNQITLRLRRVSDGVYIYEETFNPQIGAFYEYLTPFQEVPDSTDQIYTLEAVLEGDAADDLYINDAYSEIAQIRYFLRLGGFDQYLHDVTDLAYTDTAIVSTNAPVNELSVQSVILSPTAFQYAAVITPNYLK